MVMTLLTRPKRTVATVVVATDGSGDFNTDGTADDIEINAAIDSLPAGGGCIYMKEGTYNIVNSVTILNDNISIIGCGNSTVLFLVDNSDTHVIHVGDGATALENIKISNIRIDGNALNQGAGLWNGIYLEGAFGGPYIIQSDISSCNIYDCYRAGIYAEGAQDCLILGNILVSASTTYSIFLQYSTRCTIQGNITRTGSTGIAIWASNRILVMGNECSTHSLYGFYFDGSDYCLILGNLAEACVRHGFYLGTEESTITSNIAIDNDSGATGIYDGINVRSGQDNNIISSNRCDGNGGYGIRIAAASCDDTIVIGNQCLVNTTGGILDGGTNTQVFNNVET